ncbi:hypothetical protein FB451DRAFT_243218 [Mycena latifolia]|nr:hypothetical protein FB451DRAFT_243218 [Mycena latifolia]
MSVRRHTVHILSRIRRSWRYPLIPCTNSMHRAVQVEIRVWARSRCLSLQCYYRGKTPGGSDLSTKSGSTCTVWVHAFAPLCKWLNPGFAAAMWRVTFSTDAVLSGVGPLKTIRWRSRRGTWSSRNQMVWGTWGSQSGLEGVCGAHRRWGREELGVLYLVEDMEVCEGADDAKKNDGLNGGVGGVDGQRLEDCPHYTAESYYHQEREKKKKKVHRTNFQTGTEPRCLRAPRQ